MPDQIDAQNAAVLPKVNADPKIPTPAIYVWTWRGSQHRYMTLFRGEFAKLFVKEIISVTQSESDGNICVTLFYR